MSHVAAGTRNYEPAIRFHRQRFWGALLGPFVVPGRPTTGGTSRVDYWFCGMVGLTVPSSTRAVHDRALFDTGSVDLVAQRRQAVIIEICSPGRKGDQAPEGSVIVRISDDAWGARPG